MTSSSFLNDPHQILVADASVLINLNATGYASRIVVSLPGSFVVTESTFAELGLGAAKGHKDGELVRDLFDAGTAQLVHLTNAGNDLYRSLVDGAAERTLDDGEAATIAYAQEASGIALIDERKARALCAERFPALPLASTVDLLIHAAVREELGPGHQVQAVTNALRRARMRVPPHQLDLVIGMIGQDEAANCNSLPRRRRTQS